MIPHEADNALKEFATAMQKLKNVVSPDHIGLMTDIELCVKNMDEAGLHKLKEKVQNEIHNKTV